ncbi:MAG: efflux RND transporter periplasmic adaptor subunit [Phycisphaerales bacterium]|jgi:RND family efflux transporter MFP subunit
MHALAKAFVLPAIATCVHTLHVEDPTPSATATGDEGRIIQVESPDQVLPGVVRPRRSVTVGSAFDGLMLEMLATEGQRVRQGEVIARLDDRVAVAAAALARQEADQGARLNRASLRVANAERVLDRTRSLQKRGAATDEEVVNAQFELEIAQTELVEAREQQDAAELRSREALAQVERHRIRAPFDGVVVRRMVEDGAVVRGGDPVALLSDIDQLSTDLFLPAAAALDVRAGNTYAIHLHEPLDAVVFARARYVEPEIEPTSGTMRVVFDFELPAGRVPAGVLATAADRLPTSDELARFEQEEAAMPAVAAGRDG